MGSLLSSLPAWRFVDPLPVLGSLVEDDDGDDESLASMVKADSQSVEQAQLEASQITKNQSEPFKGEIGCTPISG